MHTKGLGIALGAAVLLASEALAQTEEPAFVEHPIRDQDMVSACVDDQTTCSGSAIGLEDITNWAPLDQTGKALEPPDGETPDATGDGALASVEFEVFFDYNSDRLTSRARRQIDALVPGMIKAVEQNYRLVFLGHTDSVGGYDYNLDLSKRRARAVGVYVLSRIGVAPQWIATQGLAYSKPRNLFDTTAAENRRVQLVLYPI